MLKKRYEIQKRICFFASGLLIMSFGLTAANKSMLGVSPVDVIFTGFAKKLNITYGMGLWICSLGFILLAGLIRKKFPRFQSLIASFFIGLFIDIWSYLIFRHFTFDNMYLSIFLLFIGQMLVALGIALQIISQFTPSAVDELLVSLFERTKLSIGNAKYILDIFFVIAGVLLGGNFGLGTLYAFISTGFFLQIFYKVVEKIYNRVMNIE